MERSVWEELSADAVHAISTLMPFYPLTPSGMLNLTLVNKATRDFLKDWLEECKQKTARVRSLCEKIRETPADLAAPDTTSLDISGFAIGKGGMSSLCEVIANGALASLEEFILDENQIADAGMISFSNAIKPTPQTPLGSLSTLEYLILDDNAIGDAGLAALASACASRAMAKLETLHLFNNQIGDAGMQAFSTAIASGALLNLGSLGLGSNQIGNAGVQALAGAITSGALPKLAELCIYGNPGNTAEVENACEQRGIYVG